MTSSPTRRMLALSQKGQIMRPFTRSLAIALFIGVPIVGACDSKENKTEAESEKTAKEEVAAEDPGEGKFSIQTLKISGSQAVYQIDGAPRPEEVEDKLTAAIEALDTFAEDGPRGLSGMVTYDVRPLPTEGYDVMLIGGLNSPRAKFSAGANYKSTDEKWKGKSLQEMVDGAVEEFASRIGAQAKVLGSDVDGLVKILKDEDEPQEAKLLAIQEIRERDAKEHLDDIRPLLDDSNEPELRTAAAATLVSMGDDQSRSAILKTAEDFSREKNPQYVPMLHILASLGGNEIISYLEAVAEGHSAPAVREVAKEALSDARENRRKEGAR